VPKSAIFARLLASLRDAPAITHPLTGGVGRTASTAG